jgi:hypothetical protein
MISAVTGAVVIGVVVLCYVALVVGFLLLGLNDTPEDR